MSMEEEKARQGKSADGSTAAAVPAPVHVTTEDEELAAALAMSMGVQDTGDVEMTADEEMARAIALSMEGEGSSGEQQVIYPGLLFILCHNS